MSEENKSAGLTFGDLLGKCPNMFCHEMRGSRGNLILGIVRTVDRVRSETPSAFSGENTMMVPQQIDNMLRKQMSSQRGVVELFEPGTNMVNVAGAMFNYLVSDDPQDFGTNEKGDPIGDIIFLSGEDILDYESHAVLRVYDKYTRGAPGEPV